MFTSIVVALDFQGTGDRALPFAASLATLGGLPVELITVSSPGMPAAVDVYELERRATAHALVDYSCLVFHDDDPGAAIVEHMAARPGALLVAGTTAKGPLSGHLLGSVSEYVLGRICTPVLVAGPRATAGALSSPTLIACVGDSDRLDTAEPAIASWVRTFGGVTWIATVQSSTDSNRDTAVSDAAERLRQLSERLASIDGIGSTSEVLRGDDPVSSLDEFARTVADPVFVAVSAQWADAQFHRHSFTRQLVRRSTRPVLVVPAGRAIVGDVPSAPQRARA